MISLSFWMLLNASCFKIQRINIVSPTLSITNRKWNWNEISDNFCFCWLDLSTSSLLLSCIWSWDSPTHSFGFESKCILRMHDIHWLHHKVFLVAKNNTQKLFVCSNRIFIVVFLLQHIYFRFTQSSTTKI